MQKKGWTVLAVAVGLLLAAGIPYLAATAVQADPGCGAKMAGQIRDGESFRQLSLEHAKLLTDLQASHLRHMEGMMGGGK